MRYRSVQRGSEASLAQPSCGLPACVETKLRELGGGQSSARGSRPWPLVLAMACAGLTAACREPNPSPKGSEAATASVAPFVRASASPAASASAAAVAATTSNPKVPASAQPSADAPVASAAPAVSAEVNVPLPNVEVKNIGMHIGGGPNDAKTKRPIRAAVFKHYDALRACYAKAKNPRADETFGVDMAVPFKGGLAKISNARTGLEGPSVKRCMVRVFERVEFVKDSSVRGWQHRMVSFSVRFRKRK